MRLSRVLFGVIAALAAFVADASAQTSPALRYDQTLTNAEWNALFASKQDWLGTPPLTLGNIIGVPPISATVVGSTVQISFSGTFTNPIKLSGVGTSNPTGTGQLSLGTSTVNGGVLSGQGTTFDLSLANSTGGIACGVLTGTQNILCNGSITAGNLIGGTAAGSSLTLKSTSNGSPSGDVIAMQTGGGTKLHLDGSGNLLLNAPALSVTQASTLGVKLNSVFGTGYFTFEGPTPTLITIDTTGSAGGSTISHSSVWDTACYDSGGTYTDSCFKMNPGFSYSHAGHMQSDIDWLGYFDGKGVVGLLGYSTGCTTSGNGSGPGACSVNANPTFIPVPDALTGNSPFTNGSVWPVGISATASSGGNVQLTLGSTANFTSGMYCFVNHLSGTTEANGRHLCNVSGSTLILTDQTFSNAYASNASFTASIAPIGSTTTSNLTVTAVGSGTLTVGDAVLGSGVAVGSVILSQTSGSAGSTGVYVINNAQTIGSEAMTSTGTVAIMNPTDLGASSHTWNDFYLGGNIYEGVGTAFNPAVAGYRVFAQNSANQTSGLGDIIEQYLANVPAFIISTNASGTTLGTLTNTALAIYTNNTLQFAFSAAGGFGVGTLSDPGAGAIYINNATYLMRNKTTFTNGSGGSSGTLTNAPSAGNPTKWISIDDNGTTRKIPAW